ncbi:MAG: DinB family protein [Fimbriimonadales bacterium]|nr:DinB family protein [Fimbriimonadales bacterium]
MDAREFLILLTDQQVDALFRFARAVPEEQREWRPMDRGRSVLDQVRECAGVPRLLALMVAQGPSAVGGAEFEARMREWSAWTLDEAETICREDTRALAEALRSLSEDDLERKFPSPFRPGTETSILELAATHCWNLIYHVGQIAYIQTLLGDQRMH